MNKEQTYIAPAIEIIEMETSESIMNVSPNAVDDAGVNDTPTTGGGNFWGD